MKNDNFYKTLRIVCLILAIVCMALSLFKKAKATEVNYSSWFEYVYNDTYNRCNQSTRTSLDNLNYIDLIDSLTTNFPYFLRYSNQNTNDVYYIFSIAEEFAVQTMWGSFSNDIVHVQLNYSSSSLQTNGFNYSYAAGTNVSPILVSFNNFNWNCIFPTIYISNDGYIQINNLNFYYSTSVTNMTYYENHNNVGTVSRLTTDLNGYGRYLYAFYSNITDSSEKTFDTFDSNCKCYVTQDYNRGVYNHLDNTLTLLQSNTEDFEVYKYGSVNNERLVCDFTNCISISQAVGNSSTISIKMEIDSVEHTFNFDSSSNYYYYNNGSYIAARYSFPFSVFGINQNTINARLLNVTITNSTSSPGGTTVKNINWVTPFVLVGSNYEDESASIINKDTLPNYNKFNDPTTEQSYKETTNRWLTSTYNTLPLSLFNRWNFEVRYKVIPVYDEGLGSQALNAFLTAITQVLNLQFGDVIQTAIELYNGHSIYEIIEDVLQNNQYSEYYDLIAFCYQDANGSDPIYYIYTTDTYNNHLTNSYLYDIMQSIYDDGKALDSIYNYLYDRLDDFETKSLNKVNEAVGLGEIENDLLEKIRKLLDQILDAILNINIDIPEVDYTDILSKLDTIIDNQDTSDINDDWYQNYREWLYGINENDSYLSPHEYFNNIFGTLKTTFDSFSNNISFNAYLLKVEDLINHISGNTTDNLTIYLRDGIGDPGFNINNNYMYSVGGQ